MFRLQEINGFGPRSGVCVCSHLILGFHELGKKNDWDNTNGRREWREGGERGGGEEGGRRVDFKVFCGGPGGREPPLEKKVEGKSTTKTQKQRKKDHLTLHYLALPCLAL